MKSGLKGQPEVLSLLQNFEASAVVGYCAERVAFVVHRARDCGYPQGGHHRHYHRPLGHSLVLGLVDRHRHLYLDHHFPYHYLHYARQLLQCIVARSKPQIVVEKEKKK